LQLRKQDCMTIVFTITFSNSPPWQLEKIEKALRSWDTSTTKSFSITLNLEACI